MRAYGLSDIGKLRPINEDSFYLPREDERFCAVADGMGGHNAGEVASAMAIDVFSEELRACDKLGSSALHRAVERANSAVFEKSRSLEKYSGMGTTFTGLALSERGVHIAHVGDSRAYLIRGGNIMRLTMDHTLVEEMVLKGLITPREARHHPKRNYITRALGTAAELEPDMIQIRLQRGDVFFLCTDGLSNHVEDYDILEVTLCAAPWQDKLKALVDAALDAGGQDNITAMYALFEEEFQ